MASDDFNGLRLYIMLHHKKKHVCIVGRPKHTKKICGFEKHPDTPSPEPSASALNEGRPIRHRPKHVAARNLSQMTRLSYLHTWTL